MLLILKTFKTMKTLFLIVTLALSTFISKAQSRQFCYVITKCDTIYCTNITTGFTNTTCKFESGTTIKLKNSDVVAYFVDNTLKQRLPVYIKNLPNGKNQMMKLVDCRNGLKIFKYLHYNGLDGTMDAIFSFYHNDCLVAIQTNPDLEQMDYLVKNWKSNDLSAETTQPLASE